MSLETLILILVLTVVVVCAGVCVLISVMWWRVNQQLMWFHNAGNSMAKYELEKARIALDMEKTQLEASKTEVARIRAMNETAKEHSPTGGQGRKLV